MPKINFNFPYSIKERKRKAFKIILIRVFNGYLPFLCGSLFVFYHNSNRLLSLLALIIAFLPLLDPLEIE